MAKLHLHFAILKNNFIITKLLSSQIKRLVSNSLAQQQEEVSTQYRKEHILMEDEREQLQKERNQLSWD